MVNGLFPVVTIALSLVLYDSLWTRTNLVGILLVPAAIVLMAFDDAKPANHPFRRSDRSGRGAQYREEDGSVESGFRRLPARAQHIYRSEDLLVLV